MDWGRQNDIYLILDMHVAPGGAGIVACGGCGAGTWDDRKNQKRMKAIWGAIARRYKDESQIAAYDLLNEPAPTRSASQWKDLAQDIVREIRKVDRNHLIIIERVNWIFDRNSHSPLNDLSEDVFRTFQVGVQDNNVIYDNHFYVPQAYTLQDETGVPGGPYPDTSVREETLDGRSMPRTREFLRHEFLAEIKNWQSRGVPLNIGEWSTALSAIRDRRKGGLDYLRDMLEIMEQSGVSWQFYDMNRLFKIDCCYADNPTVPRDHKLLDLFRQYFAGR